VVSIPPSAYSAVPAEALAGKPVLDTINFIPQRDGPIPELSDGQLRTSEVLQRHLDTAHVVKVFNNITLHVHLLGSADFTSWGARATIERPAPWGLQLDLISRASRFGDHCSIH